MNKKILILIGVVMLFLASDTSAFLLPKCSVNSHVPDFTNENKLPTSPGDYIRFIISDWRIRSYKIHIPPTYNGNTPTSLVLALHGGGGRSQTMEKKTEFSEKADEEGFIAVYPNGISRFLLLMRTWNAGHCCGIALEKNIDDVKFIRELVNKLQLQLNIDPSRIYITGHSNGAMMAYRLGTELSDVIAAIAPCAGTIGGKTTEDSPLYVIPEPDYPVSVIALHGKLDENVPYDGGRGENTSGSRIDLSVNESISFWVQHNECNPIPQTNISESGNIVTDTYSGGKNGTEVVLCTIVNGEHWWPGSDKDPYQEISATDVIWDFFESHPKQ